MSCVSVTVKSCLGLISLFLWACAVTLIVLGALILGSYGHLKELSDSAEILVPSSIIIGAGVFLFIVGLLGCIGGMKENKCCLTLFFILMLLILLSELVGTYFAFHLRSQVSSNLSDDVNKLVKRCANGTKVDCDEMDWLQSTFKCCGADGYMDWVNVTVNSTVPDSCCVQTGCNAMSTATYSYSTTKMALSTTSMKMPTNATVTPTAVPQNMTTTNPPSRYFSQGCTTQAVNEFRKLFEWVAVGAIAIACIQVLGLVATCVLLLRSKETPYINLDSQGYRI